MSREEASHSLAENSILILLMSSLVFPMRFLQLDQEGNFEEIIFPQYLLYAGVFRIYVYEIERALCILYFRHSIDS